jgi:ribosomal protein L34E
MNGNGEEKNMAKCIRCGAEVGTPKKRWKMTGRPDKTGKRTQLEIGLFECPKCHTKFRVALSKHKV